MSAKILVCFSEISDGCIRIKSPSIGRVSLSISDGSKVSPGQIIGELYRLEQRFLLKLDEESAGLVVKLSSHDRVMPLAYKQTIMELKENVAETAADKKQNVVEKSSGSNSVDAPMDGMFYLSPSPKDPPYVNIGDLIAPGQTIGLIEVMKCFYPLKYQGHDRAKIVDIKVKSASPVSHGTQLMIIVEP